MMPNIHIHEQLMFDHVKERQCQSEQQRQLAHLHTPLILRMHNLLKRLSALFAAVSTRSKQFEQTQKPLV